MKVGTTWAVYVYGKGVVDTVELTWCPQKREHIFNCSYCDIEDAYIHHKMTMRQALAQCEMLRETMPEVDWKIVEIKAEFHI